MSLTNREALLTSLEQVVEQHLQVAVRQFQNLDDTSLLKPAPDGGWSIAQCLAHLTSYGNYYLPRIKQALAAQPHAPASNSVSGTWLGRYFIRLMDPTASAKKFKAARQHRPESNLSGHTVVAEFIQQQEELLFYLRQARQVDLDAIRIPVSVVLWLRLNLGDLFQFLIVHDERHLLQARRNLL